MKYGTIWCVCLSGQGHNRQPSDRRESKVAHIYDAPPPTKDEREETPDERQGKGQRGGARVPKGVSHSVACQGRSTRDMRQRDKVALPSLCTAAVVPSCVWACSTKWGSAHAGHACSRLDIKSSLAAIERVSERIHGLICVIAVIALSCNFHQRDRKTRLRECGGAHCKSLNLEQALLHSLR